MTEVLLILGVGRETNSGLTCSYGARILSASLCLVTLAASISSIPLTYFLKSLPKGALTGELSTGTRAETRVGDRRATVMATLAPLFPKY